MQCFNTFLPDCDEKKETPTGDNVFGLTSDILNKQTTFLQPTFLYTMLIKSLESNCTKLTTKYKFYTIKYVVI